MVSRNGVVRTNSRPAMMACEPTGDDLSFAIMENDRPPSPPAGRVDSSRVPSLTGRVVGGFLLEERLGTGGYGAIYRATQQALGRNVAVKAMFRKHPQDATSTKRFLREARLASRLDHPYAAHIYAFGAEDDGLLWIAMELVRGTSLKQLLTTQGAFSVARFSPLLQKICEVIYTAHQQGIVHRDIKPSNVMVVSRAGRLLPKLVDLGIARAIEQGVGYHSDAFALAALTGSEAGGSISNSELMGSPPYMAPERWERSSVVDSRADQYALAVLTFELLTGRRPFSGSDASALSMAHQFEPIPSLGDRFPPALDQVLARGLAKDPDERYSDVLAFSTAFHAAAELDGDSEPIPKLGPTLRERLLASAPQPLADSVARLEATHDPEQAIEAALIVGRVAVRVAGVLAIAASARLGVAHGEHAIAVKEALKRLHNRVLTIRDWLEIIAALVHPFAARPDVYPVPELVLLFEKPIAGPELSDDIRSIDMRADETSTERFAIVREARELERQARHEEPHEALTDMLHTLTQILERLLFVCDYRLLARRDGRDEVWMGVTGTGRATVSRKGVVRRRGDGEVVLIGTAGEQLLTLTPLCRLLAPAPGVPKTMFLFDGKSRYGARMVSFPVGFEWHDRDFWDWYDTEFSHTDRRQTSPLEQGEQEGGAPYLGLSAFSPADSANYVGREREVSGCVNRLRVEPLLAIVGPSGAGKSSFVQAGIIPSLPRNWRAHTVRPGRAPLSALAGRLDRAGLGCPSGDTHARISTDAGGLGSLLRDHASASGEMLVLVIDQFEELLTLGSDEHERALYTEALMYAARTPRDPVRVILTVRDDFLLRAQQLPVLRERLSHSLQLLATPPVDELERILLEPARRVGYRFEDDELPREMVQAIADEPGALALLSFTASKLWELRDRESRQLRRDAYRELGGVGGALARHAEDTLARMSPERQQLVREVCRQLITAEGTRAVLSRRELTQLLGDHADAEGVLEDLIGARLLVAFEGEQGQDRVEVVHEALLRSWPRLVAWQRQDAESARLRDQLRATARQWIARGQPQGLLWRDDALLEYRVWRSRYRGSLTDDEHRFADASLGLQVQGQRRRRLLLITAFGVLIIGLVSVLLLAHQADLDRRQAVVAGERANILSAESASFANQSEERLFNLYQEQGRLALLADDPLRALVYLNAVEGTKRDEPAHRFMLGRVHDTLSDQLWAVHGHRGSVFAVRFSPDGSLLASGGEDRHIRLWNANDGALKFTLKGHEKTVWQLAFSPDGARLVSGSLDGTVRAWDVQTGALVWTADRNERGVTWVAFSPDGKRIGTASNDAAITLLDAQSGALQTTWKQTDGVLSGAFSVDGKYIVTGGVHGIARLWDVASQRLVRSSTQHDGPIFDVEFSPDGERVATASNDSMVRIFSTSPGRDLSVPERHQTVNRVRFSPDGTRLLVASEASDATLRNALNGERIMAIGAHESGVGDALFSPDGTLIATLSRDATAKLWDVRTGFRLRTLFGHQAGLWTGEFDATGARLVTSSFDGVIRVWDATRTVYERRLPERETPFLDAVPAPTAPKIATIRAAGRTLPASRDALVELWSDTGRLERSQRIERMETDPLAWHVAWRADSKALIASGGVQAVVWELDKSRPLSRFGAHNGATYHGQFADDGARIITAGADKTAQSWNRATGERLHTFRGHEGEVQFVDVDRDSRYLVTSSDDHTARIWNLDTGALQAVLRHPFDVPMNTARFSADGARIIAASRGKPVLGWRIDGTLVHRFEGHADAVPSAAWSPDGVLVASGSVDGTLKIWDSTTESQLWSIQANTAPVTSVTFTADGNKLVTVQGTHVYIWNASYDTRTPDEVNRAALCRAGYSLDNGRLRTVAPQYDKCDHAGHE